VGHIHHIPMVVRGWGVGVIALGRCANIGPALCCGVKLVRDGLKLRLHGWCQLASGWPLTVVPPVDAAQCSGLLVGRDRAPGWAEKWAETLPVSLAFGRSF
jgi:hypothetical protein